MRILCLLLCLLAATALHAQNCGGMANAGGTCVPPDVAAPDYQQQPQSQQPQNVPLHPGLWINHYGALVYDGPLDKLGVSANKLSEAEAWQAAEEDCHAKGGLNCARLTAYLNQCVAAAVGRKWLSYSVGKTLVDAEKKAMNHCASHATECEVYYSACSLPVLVP